MTMVIIDSVGVKCIDIHIDKRDFFERKERMFMSYFTSRKIKAFKAHKGLFGLLTFMLLTDNDYYSLTRLFFYIQVHSVVRVLNRNPAFK